MRVEHSPALHGRMESVWIDNSGTMIVLSLEERNNLITDMRWLIGHSSMDAEAFTPVLHLLLAALEEQ